MKKAISVILALVLCLSLCACAKKAAPEIIEAYNNANACFSQERYEDAAGFYLEAGDYEDAQQKLLEIYYYAVNCYEQEKYDEAMPLFDILSGWEQHKDSIAYYNAMYNAQIEFEVNRDIVAAYEWLDAAMTHANEEQTSEFNKYNSFVHEHLYADTLFWKPNIEVDSVTEVEGKYIHYHYDFNNYNGAASAEEFANTHSRWYNDYEREWFQPVPEWLMNITGNDYADEVCYDSLGNMIAFDFALSKNSKGDKYIGGGTADVYIIYADYINSVNN